MIKQAGRELKSALDRAAEGGGVHLRAVYERVEVSFAGPGGVSGD